VKRAASPRVRGIGQDRADEQRLKEEGKSEMRKLFLGVVASAAMLTSAGAAVGAEDEMMFMHNGSLMRMVTLPYGRGIEIRYEEPRPGLQDVGVRQGTLLFRGSWRGNTLVGQALVFPNGCRSVPYEVKGYVGRYGEIVLEGMAPVVQPYSCVFVGWERNRNSYLRFDPAA
jgi:hypothetical protein